MLDHLRVGIDLVEIERVQQSVARYGERFLKRIFTEKERTDVQDHPASLAARFAAKEAVAKALGCGIGEVGWQEIEIRRGPSGEPLLQLHGRAQAMADELQLRYWAVSLSHTRSLATAVVVASQERI